MSGTYRQDETVTTLEVRAGQVDIDFDEHTVDGFGTIADMLEQFGLTPANFNPDDHSSFRGEIVIVDEAKSLVYLLVHIFPKLEAVTIYRSLGGADGGGSYAWRTYRPVWNKDKENWDFRVTSPAV